VNTRLCRECGCAYAAKVRESVNIRGPHEYTMRWYICPDCRDVSFSYRISGTSPQVRSSEPGAHGIEADAPAAEEAALSTGH
jgi:hypothetical protein